MEFCGSSSLIMALQVCSCFALSCPKQNQTHTQNFIFPKTLLSPSLPKAPSSSSSSSSSSSTQNRYPEKSNDIFEEFNLSISFSKRSLNLSILALFFNGFLPNLSKCAYAEELELQRYTDSKEGFTLLIPSSFNKVEKAGATVLFEEEGKGSNNVGVVVNPVRLSSLGEFGTPEFVVEKLIQAEKRKESTTDAEVIGVAERSGQGGLQVYEFEYKVDSTRGGMKRIFSAAFVASKKLYLLNIAHSDKPESPLDAQTRTMLEQVLHSFDFAPQT